VLIEQYVYYYPIALLFVAYAVIAVLRTTPRPRLDWWVTACGLLACVVKTIAIPSDGFDFGIFHQAGQAVITGENPYAMPTVLNPPPALPVFALFASLPESLGRTLWTGFNLLCALALVPLAAWTVRRMTPAAPLPASLLGILTVVVGLSLPVHFNHGLGQLSLWTTLNAFLALALMTVQRPGASGVFLALVALKPQNAVPWLLLFGQRGAWRAWVVSALVVGILTMLAGPPAELIERIRQMLANIAALNQPGAVNDFSDAGPQRHMLIGFDRLLWCLGVHDRTWVGRGTLILTGVIGLRLALVVWRQRLARDWVAALVALYTLLFLYHRVYDAVLLALPLVIVVRRYRNRTGTQRGLLLVFGLLLGVLYLHPKMIELLALRLGVVGRMFVMPYATWCVLFSMEIIARQGIAEWKRKEPTDGSDSTGGVTPGPIAV